MTKHIDAMLAGGRRVTTLAGQDGQKTIIADILCEFSYSIGHEPFDLQVTYQPADGTGAAVTEPVSGRRVVPISADHLHAATYSVERAARYCLDRLVEQHGRARVASTLRAAVGGELK